MSEFTVSPTLPSWIKDHLRRYLDTGGEDGHLWDAESRGGIGFIPTLLLVTTGRRSGKPLTLPLIYGECPSGWVVVASKGGAPAHPAWYLNLVAQPDVQVQVKADRCHARARTTSGEERARLWAQMAALYPPYETYQAKTNRAIPVVVLERR